jgi:hypothetical protein
MGLRQDEISLLRFVGSILTFSFLFDALCHGCTVNACMDVDWIIIIKVSVCNGRSLLESTRKLAKNDEGRNRETFGAMPSPAYFIYTLEATTCKF